MDEAALSRRLAVLEPVEIDAARERAKLAVSGSPSGGSFAARVSCRRSGLRIAVACLVIGIAAGALTSPGQSVAHWIGDRLGFGGPGEQPTLTRLRAFGTHGTAAQGQPAYVLVRGPAPHGNHYEFVTYRAKDEPGKLWPAGARCFELNFPEARGIANAGCGLPPAGAGLLLEGIGGGSSRSGGEYHYAGGRVSDDIDSVEVEFNGRQVPVELVSVPPDLIERLSIRRPFKFFIAFLDHARHGGTVTVTARDGAARAVAHADSFIPDIDAARRSATALRR